MLIEVTPEEAKALQARRDERIAVARARAGIGIQGKVLRRFAHFTVTKYYGGHHPQYAVYDEDRMICLCVYRKGAFALLDFIKAAIPRIGKEVA